MDTDTAANFLVGSILFGLGFAVLTIAIVFINNVFHKYWRPVTLFDLPKLLNPPPARFITPEEMEAARIPPVMDHPVSTTSKKE
jgi:hypothetical protein